MVSHLEGNGRLLADGKTPLSVRYSSTHGLRPLRLELESQPRCSVATDSSGGTAAFYQIPSASLKPRTVKNFG